MEKLAAQTADAFQHFGRVYLAVLFNPGHEIPGAASGSVWPFPLALIFGYSAVSAILLRISWTVVVPGLGLSSALVETPPRVVVVCLAQVVFFVGLSIAMLAGARIFTRQRVGLLIAMNCVAVAVVPLSALTLAAWIVLYFSPALSLLVLVFGFLVALCFFAEALRSQCDLPAGSSLYAIPLMVVVALVLTGLFLFILSGHNHPS